MTQALGGSLAARPAKGGSLRLRVGDRPLDELLSIAAAASRSRSRIELTGTRAKPLEDLMRIAVTGGDCVVFGVDHDERPALAASSPRRRWWFSRETR